MYIQWVSKAPKGKEWKCNYTSKVIANSIKANNNNKGNFDKTILDSEWLFQLKMACF